MFLSIRPSYQTEIQPTVKRHLLTFNGNTMYTNRPETEHFIQSYLLLPHVFIVLREEPTVPQEENKAAYQIIRLLQGAIGSVDKLRCRYHDGEPLLQFMFTDMLSSAICKTFLSL